MWPGSAKRGPDPRYSSTLAFIHTDYMLNILCIFNTDGVFNVDLLGLVFFHECSILVYVVSW